MLQVLAYSLAAVTEFAAVQTLLWIIRQKIRQYRDVVEFITNDARLFGKALCQIRNGPKQKNVVA
ncbi:hypothetical protein [Pandoraea norimbergensis]|uniref:hypothetical protein n=1 Tax=Pandoraea norimbergensis TaxID=93219 RepID=UPI0012F47C41|nr:hypothetical protein [Pandoraea norimbergensis]